ncbi:hypothetical protein KJ665_02965, partial [Patescibacteria group bacterium]|nr:hypothetical protein [Patescibacteria group bacterium]
MENPNFLKQKYDLHNAPEVEAATKRAEIRSDEKIPQNPADRIQNYLDRFKEITDRENPDKREHGIDALKRLLHAKFVIKPEEIPEAYFDNQKRLAREQGHGDIEITDEMREQLTEVIITDQKSTLDNWIEYLSSPDATYPDWLKYYAIRSILGMGEFDKEKKQFTKRSAGTVKPFPDLNREALAYVLDSIEKKQAGIKTVSTIDLETNEEEYKKFEKILQGENFAKLYAWAIDKVTPASQEALAKTQGKWVKYDRNSDHMPLVESLQSHGTGWCTAGESTAHAQLQGGDFYVYYSFDEHGKPVIPRAAIRMQENGIAEVRGVASEQNIDPYIGDIVKQKLTEFPDGKAYEKKSADMKLLTEIDNKVKQKKPLTKEDIVFLYEINEKIEGFGYQRDPRIEEIRNQRNPQEDVVIVFECTKDQIAYDISEIKENTKAYIGPLVPGIFNVIREHNIEHIYTSFPFPEGRIYIESVEIGKKDAGELIREMREKNINVRNYAGDMMKDKDFTVLKESESIALIRLKVGDLGFSKYKHPTTNEIYKRIQELGLKLCPAEAGP